MHKLIITNGPDLNPSWTDRIAVTKDYQGKGALTLLSALGAGGSLVVGNDYFYKVIALVRKGITIAGDGAGQLSAITLDGPVTGKLFWKLTNTGTTRTFVLARDPQWLQIVASGTRANDGVLTFTAVNGSLINGTVTVAYTADDGGDDNTITVAHTYYAGNEEATETIVTATRTIDLTWTAPSGEVDGYRIYRGDATGVYDGFFTSVTNSYSDDGTTSLSADEAWFKDDIRIVSGHFLPPGSPLGLAHLTKCTLNVTMKDGTVYPIDLTKVSNHATWSTGLFDSVYVAENEFNEWL